MKKAVKWLAWVVGGVLLLAALGNSEPWQQVTIIVVGVVIFCYGRLSKQIAKNHDEMKQMVENTYRAAAGMPRDE